MPALPHIPLPLIIAAVLFLVIVIVAMIYVKNYIKVGPNEVAVFFGRGEPKFVRGGGRFRIPGIETVKKRTLEPFKINVRVENVYSSDNVPVMITGFGQVAFGLSEDELRTSMSKYLDSDDRELLIRFTEIMQGSMRQIAAGLTVEKLNNDRTGLAQQILNIAKDTFEPLGMIVPTLNIQDVDDKNGYLAALGQSRIAEVKRDAAIGQANARRVTMEREAEADQLGKTAQATAATNIAKVERDRDLELARISAEVDAERATAAQKGPLAEAEAKAAVGVANANAERQREEANIRVEEQRALRSRAAQEADVIIPAEARRQASVIQAEGERDAAVFAANADKQTTIARAEAAAEQRRLSSSAEAEATTNLAAAKLTDMRATADGEAAKLFAQATGQEKLAEAYNKLSERAGRLQNLPLLIRTMPDIAREIASGVKIDRMVVMDGGSGTGLQRAASTVPAILNQVTEVARGLGFDLNGLLGSVGVTDLNSGPETSQKAATDQVNPVATSDTTPPAGA